MGLTITACSPTDATLSPSPIFTLASVTATPMSDPTPWPLQVEMRDSGNWDARRAREQLLELVPGESTLQDLYSLVGYPDWRRDFPSGVALRYASELGKLPHVVLVDGVTGKVLLVSVYNHNNEFYSLVTIKSMYGEPTLASTIYTRDHLLFTNAGIAIIAGSEDNNDISLEIKRE